MTTICKQQRNTNVQGKLQAGFFFLRFGFLTIFPPGSSWGKTQEKQAVAPACGVLEPCRLDAKPPFPRPQQGCLSSSCPPKPRHQRQPPCPSTGLKSPWHKPASGSSLAKLVLLSFRQHLPTFYFHIVLICSSLKRKRGKKERAKRRKIWFGCLCHSIQT